MNQLLGRRIGKRRSLVVLLASAGLVSCSGQDSDERAEAPGTNAAVATTEPTSPPSSPPPISSDTTPSVPAAEKQKIPVTSDDGPDPVASAIRVISKGRLVLLQVDDACVDRAFAELPLRVRRAIDAMIDDPLAGRVDAPAVKDGLVAYFGCMDSDALSASVASSLVRIPDVDCVVGSWDGLLSAELVSSSLVHGTGLDDLPADVVADLAAAAAPCQPDPEWWVSDVIAEHEIDLDVAEPELECSAARYVEIMGAEEVIRRRLLDAPLLALPADQEARLDLAATCGVTDRGTLDVLVADLGACVADFRVNDAAVTDCDQAHDTEVYAVQDLSTDHPSWPGIQTVVDTANSRCRATPDVIAGDSGDHEFAVLHPVRSTWEQGDRSVLCLVVHEGNGVWTGPSGLVPAAEGTTPTTVVTTTSPAEASPPTATTLPPGARELFSIEEINRVGMCIYRAPALPGQDDESRRFFEVDCGQPHQAEMYHRFDLAGPPGTPYPGDAAIQTEGDAVCRLTFAAYVGISYEKSRLFLTYFYPSPETWIEGDRTVTCFLVGAQVDELLTRSMAGSGE